MSSDASHSGLAGPLLARLDGVRPVGSGRWYARCPAHDDKSPSLSIRETADRVLINDFGGCGADDVLAAVGLSWRDLYPEPFDCARKQPNEAVAAYARKTLAAADPLDIERQILRLAAADIRAGRLLSAEDRGRVEVARTRLAAASGRAA